jgi:hypothetical protein
MASYPFHQKISSQSQQPGSELRPAPDLGAPSGSPSVQPCDYRSQNIPLFAHHNFTTFHQQPPTFYSSKSFW